MSADDRDPNVLARRLADARDELETLRKEMAETQERWLLERARLTLALGMSVDEIPEHLWEDGPKIAQSCLDMVWDNGYRDGLATAEQAIRDLLKKGGSRD